MPIVTQLLSSENHVAQKAALTVLFMISASSDAVRQAMISKYNILQPLSAILELDYPEARDAKLTALQLLVNLSYTGEHFIVLKAFFKAQLNAVKKLIQTQTNCQWPSQESYSQLQICFHPMTQVCRH